MENNQKKTRGEEVSTPLDSEDASNISPSNLQINNAGIIVGPLDSNTPLHHHKADELDEH